VPNCTSPTSKPLAYVFVVADAEGGQRLDQYLAARELPHSRSQIKKHLDARCCQVNERPARPSTRLQPGDTVAYAPPPLRPASVQPEDIALSVLFEDEHVIVVDKPAGMVVHPSPGHDRGTLVAALLARCGDLSGVGDELRPGIVHRLDKLTSGVMVATKNDAAHQALAAQFKAHSIERRYLALVAGYLDSSSGSFRTLHGRHPTDRKRFTSRCERGRQAVTHYRVVARLRGASLVEARLETGRTHQVRVHFADHGHALLGDPMYGRLPADGAAREVARTLGRQALHAQLLGFDHPHTGRPLRFMSPPPPDMQGAIDALTEIA
jgi:23S rRNA pseudouridine1911/1915/1917 synthase